MKYRQALQVKLQERYRRLYKAHHDTHHNEAGYLVAFILETPALTHIVKAIEGDGSSYYSNSSTS